MVLLVASLPVMGAEKNPNRVAVLPFDDGSIEHWWGDNWQVGSGLSDMIVTEMLAQKRFRMIEREQINKVLQEQDFGASGRVDPSSAAKIGKILGVRYILIGKVTEFSIKSQKANLIVVSAKTSTARVAIDGRLVDTTTAEIVAGVTGSAEKKKTTAFNIHYYYSVGFNSSDFQSDFLGQATRECVQDFVTKLTANFFGNSDVAPPTPDKLTGSVAYASGDKVIINLGSKDGITPGMTFTVVKVLKEVRDPDTNEVIDNVTETIAEIQVSEVKEKSSTCLVTERFSNRGIDVKDQVIQKF